MLLSPLPHIRKYLRKKLRNQVYAGVYEGMLWQEVSTIDCFESKLMGIYEKELYPTIEKILDTSPKSITVIGVAEGYHAIGLALNSGLIPLCYERDKHAQSSLQKLARLNNVGIDLQGSFDSETTLNQPPGLIIMDIEGAEKDVLNSNRLSSWKTQHIIVEVHSQKILNALIDRSKEWFASDFISTRKRTVADYPFRIPYKLLLKRWWNVPVQEWRSNSLGWLVLTPK